MADIYNVTTNTPVAWQLDSMLMTIGDNQNTSLLATGCDLTYARQLSEFYPINQSYKILVAAPPKGTLRIQSIVGPVGDIKSFLESYGSICDMSKKNISISPGGITPCPGEENNGNKNLKFKMTGCLITTFGLQIQNQNGLGVVNSTIDITFTGLEATGGGSGAAGGLAQSAGAAAAGINRAGAIA